MSFSNLSLVKTWYISRDSRLSVSSTINHKPFIVFSSLIGPIIGQIYAQIWHLLHKLLQNGHMFVIQVVLFSKFQTSFVVYWCTVDKFYLIVIKTKPLEHLSFFIQLDADFTSTHHIDFFSPYGLLCCQKVSQEFNKEPIDLCEVTFIDVWIFRESSLIE